jgi:hypothetical protein
MIASHYAETIGRKVEEGSIKGDSVKPNAMYTCRYEPTPAQQEPCYCKDPILPGGGSDGGNSRWNEFIIPGKTMASGLVEKGMQESMYEVGTAFTLHGQRFAGTVYSGERARHLPLGALILASASAGLGGLDAADLNRASRTPRPARPAQAARALTATRLARA